MRELESANCQWVEVSYLEWLNFAEHSLDNGFYSIAGKVISILFNFIFILVLVKLQVTNYCILIMHSLLRCF
jgi:hypothetical protein